MNVNTLEWASIRIKLAEILETIEDKSWSRLTFTRNGTLFLGYGDFCIDPALGGKEVPESKAYMSEYPNLGVKGLSTTLDREDVAYLLEMERGQKPRAGYEAGGWTKGAFGSSCNITACQRPYSAFYKNTAMSHRAPNNHYCYACASQVNEVANRDGKDFFPNLGELDKLINLLGVEMSETQKYRIKVLGDSQW